MEQSKGCRAQAERQCGLVRRRESRDSRSARYQRTIMSKRKRKASSTEAPGESTASLCTAPANRQRSAGRAPLLLGKGVRLGPWLPWPCHGPFPSTASSRHGRHRAGPWGRPSGAPGPASCSPLLAFALSSAVCVLCGRADVDPDAFGHMLSESGIHVHEFCLVSSLMGSFQIPAGDAPFLSVLMRSCSFLSYSRLPTSLLKKQD